MSRSSVVRMAVGVGAVLVAAFAVGAMSDRPSSTFSQTGRAISGQEALASGWTTTADLAAPGSDDVEGDALASSDVPPDERIIRTATVNLEVAEGSFDDAWEEAFAIAERVGGSVASTERRSDDRVGAERPPVGTLVLRVPVERFEDALVAVRALGEVRLDRSSSKDVTEEYVDLQSRLRHMRAQETALLRLMTRAESVSDTLKIQKELAEVQAEIERVTGRLNFIDARADLSTITLTVGEPGSFERPVGSTLQDGEPSFAQAWDTAVEGLERMATTGLILIMWSLPFVAGSAIGLLIWRSRRTAPQV